MTNSSGNKLTLPSFVVDEEDELARRILEMWYRYNNDRRRALRLGEEARAFVLGTSIDGTSASILPHKNRTHQPKLTQISDILQSQYFEATLSVPEFFIFDSVDPADSTSAKNMGTWLQSKLEQKKYRETVGRELLADYVFYGNCFSEVDYVTERNEANEVIFRGPVIKRVSPMDIVFNPRAESFAKSVKITRRMVHIADIANWPNEFPSSGFDADTIAKAINTRSPLYRDDWVKVIKERGISFDGYSGGTEEYYRNDVAEVLIYRGDVFNPVTGEIQRNRVVYVLDQQHIIRNEASRSPKGFDGLHHAGWRIRPDNLWAQGPLDNLLGMQYRINHLENLKADVFDLIAHPVLKIKGLDVTEPENGYQPGAVYHMGLEEDVAFLVPDASALQADNQIAIYHKMMEDFAGAPPEARGVRSPGEKTAFEVSTLTGNADKTFLDKARNFELMEEGALREGFELLNSNYDGGDYIETLNDITGEIQLAELAKQNVTTRGRFTAMGSKHWERRQRETLELQNFQAGPMQDPKVRMHISGIKLTNMWIEKLRLQDANLVEEFIGVKEDVQAQGVAQAEASGIQEQAGDIAVEGSPKGPTPIQGEGAGTTEEGSGSGT